jgi:DNA polymerase
MTDTRERRMRTLATRIKNCALCPGMNIPEVTEAAPGYGSAQSPVMVVGQSLCGPCMATQIPFTGGSGRFLDRALAAAGLVKEAVFTTNGGDSLIRDQCDGLIRDPPGLRRGVVTA